MAISRYSPVPLSLQLNSHQNLVSYLSVNLGGIRSFLVYFWVIEISHLIEIYDAIKGLVCIYTYGKHHLTKKIVVLICLTCFI